MASEFLPSTKVILFVDDDVNLLKSMKRFFHQEDYKILTASSPQEAIDILKCVEVNVIVSDQSMPQMTGTEFLKTSKSYQPDVAKIMLTGNPDLETALAAVNSGDIFRFFTKPCNVIELGMSIRQALAQQELTLLSRRLILKFRKLQGESEQGKVNCLRENCSLESDLEFSALLEQLENCVNS